MTFREFVESILAFFGSAVLPLFFAAATLIFVWGVFNYFFLKREDPKARAEGAQFMLWGIIGLAVIISIFGLVNILLNTFGIG